MIFQCLFCIFESLQECQKWTGTKILSFHSYLKCCNPILLSLVHFVIDPQKVQVLWWWLFPGPLSHSIQYPGRAVHPVGIFRHTFLENRLYFLWCFNPLFSKRTILCWLLLLPNKKCVKRSLNVIAKYQMRWDWRTGDMGKKICTTLY